MKKVLVVAPVLTRSGYGEHARFVIDSLLSRSDIYDIFVHPLHWGESSWAYKHPYKRDIYEHLIRKKESFHGKYDLSIQVTVPNEWQDVAKYNIGVTAGVEASTVPVEWLKRCNSMDKIIVTSEHTRAAFMETVYDIKSTNTDEVMSFVGCQKPVEAVGYPVKNEEYTDLSDRIKLDTDFNFLTIAQLAPRKKLEDTLTAFVTQFRDNEEVGLIMKTHAKNNSRPDKDFCEYNLNQFLGQLGPRKCKVYHIHGGMEESEIHGLFHHPQIKAYVTSTHGEGFGLPLFEAAYSGMPIAAPVWSGYLDFLYAPYTKKNGKVERRACFEKIPVKIDKVKENALMDGIILPEMKWAYPDMEKTKKAMETLYRGYVSKLKVADHLKKHLVSEFSEAKQHERMCKAIQSGYENETATWKEGMEEVNVL